MGEGFLGLMATGDHITGPMNIGNPGEFTIRQLADLVIELTGAKSKLVHLPLPPDDPTQRRPDITMAQRELAWAPNVQLKEGLLKTIAYFDALLTAQAGSELSFV